jgi:hypothetical protein
MSLYARAFAAGSREKIPPMLNLTANHFSHILFSTTYNHPALPVTALADALY